MNENSNEQGQRSKSERCKRIVAVLGWGLVVVASCARPETHRVSTTTTTSSHVLMNDDAAMVMTNARCENESACDNVGESKRYINHDECRRALFPIAMGTVRAESCAAGVDEDKLAVCLGALKGQACSTQGRAAPDSCRREQLCVGD